LPLLISRRHSLPFKRSQPSTLTLEFLAPTFDPADEKTLAEEDAPADSVIYRVDEASVAGALGFHDLNTKGAAM
jgi:hypothetical protein